MKTIILTAEQVAYFWSRVNKKQGLGPKGTCWLWKGGNPEYYGAITFQRETFYAHRISWVLTNKMQVPVGRVLCHDCDNKHCVNPSHLWPGTHAENMQDHVKKGLHWTGRGPRPALSDILQGVPDASPKKSNRS